MLYRLIPTLDIGRLGSKYYLFDRHAEAENLLFVPTQAISKRMHDVIRTIRDTWPQNTGQELDAIKNLFKDPAEQKSVTTLASAGYLEPVPEIPETLPPADSTGESAKARKTEDCCLL